MQQCPSCGELVPIEYVICVWCGFDLTAEHIRRAGIKIGKRESVDRMVNLVRSPITTAKEISLIPDLTGGKLILYFIGVVMTLNMLVVFGKLGGTDFNDSEAGINIVLSAKISFIISFKFIVGLAFLAVQPIVLYLIFFGIWKFSARILLMLTKSIGGFGDILKIRSVIGYSLFPVLLGWSLSLLMTLMASPVNISGSIDYNSISFAVIEITRSGIGFVGYIFIILGWIWTVLLSVITMRQAAKLSTFESMIVAGIPSTILLVVVVFGTEFLA